MNTRGPLLQLNALTPQFQSGTSVAFNTSIANAVGLAGITIYAASKGALQSAMKVAAAEFAPLDIRVNAISPGPTGTKFFVHNGTPAEHVPATLEQLSQMIPLGRVGTSKEIANSAAFLMSDEASFITRAEHRPSRVPLLLENGHADTENFFSLYRSRATRFSPHAAPPR